MNYGRVDVYWPDGPIETHQLDKSTVALGRSTGNDIVLDTTAVSRYHVTFTFKNQQVFLEDLQSVNGTYIDGVRLAPNEPYPLRGGEEIQAGDIRLIFNPAVDVVSVPSETTQRVVVAQPTYRVELEGPDMAVAPGAYVQAALKIENLTEQAGRYTVEIEGIPKGWARVDRTEMEIDPGSQGQATISFKPLRRSESQPGDYPFVVRVRSKSQPAQKVDMPTTLRVLPYSGFGIALATPLIKDGERLKFYLHNQGNAPLPLTLQGADRAKVLRFQFSAANILLGPGENQTLVGTVSLRRRKFVGQAREREFALIAHSRDAAGFLASVPGKYVEKAMLPAWAPVLVVPVLALFALLIVAAVLFLVKGGKEEQDAGVQPVITAFTVSSPVLTLGETAQLVWAASDVETIKLIVEHGGIQQQYPLQPGTTAYPLLLNQTGRYSLALEARSGKSVATSAAIVEVLPAVALTLEVLEGDQLVRYVQQQVHISWTVTGARELDTGLYNIGIEHAGDPLLAAPLEPSGYRDVQVIPGGEEAEWLVTLHAEGEDGVANRVAQKLPLVYPSCELRAPRTIVRSGPGKTYPALVPPLESSAEGNPSLSPIARDPGGDWLQVNIGVDNPRPGWVLRADFNCTNFDPSRLVVTTEFPSGPPVTPTATLSPLVPTGSPAVPTPAIPVTPTTPSPAPQG